MKEETIGRREFLKTAAAGFAILLTEDELRASGVIYDDPPPGPPVRFGVVGIGQWGREILASLARLQSADVKVICDYYEPYLKRGLEIAPKAQPVADYRRVIESPDVEAVVLATPSHLHREIALASLQAGKHLYCEAPLASNIEDARAIALAALQNNKLVFQAGLQGRSNGLYKHVIQFVKSGVLGTPVQVIAQWNKKQSWRRAAPAPERERELNWRLSSKTSAGLTGEIGVHHLDLINWYLNRLPSSASGSGGVLNWDDGRDVPDTIQCVLEYPKRISAVFSSTLASSFSGSFTLFQGSNASLMMREKRGWMIKEADSALLGWEVYARKESVNNEMGICMVADATKLLDVGKEPGKDGSTELAEEPLQQAIESFCRSIRTGSKVSCGPLEGFQAAVTAIKANEAVMTGSKIAYDKAWFELK
jgi:predicted dehydrogenase